MGGKYIFIASKEEGKIFTDSRNTILILDSANEFEKLKEEYLDKKTMLRLFSLGVKNGLLTLHLG